MLRELSTQIGPWTVDIRACARAHGLDECVVAGLVWVESRGNPWAIRVERGFWRRYLPGIKALFRKTRTRRDDRWLKYPDLVAASYGLCQIMLPTAMERGFAPTYPTELLEPRRNIDLACQILSAHRRRAGSIEGALLRYNGGGNPDYPGLVVSAADRIRRHKILGADNG